MTAPAGRRLRLALGITIAGVLAGGGLAVAAATGGSATAAGNGTAAQTTASAQELAALQQAAGQQTGGQQTAGQQAPVTRASAAAARRLSLNRLRGLGGMYGSFTFPTKAGDQTLAFERGTITSVTGSDVVVRAADGTTMTWLLVSDTMIRDKGVQQTSSSLSDGEAVFVGGPVVSGARDARLIVVRPAARQAPAGAPASASTSAAVS